MTPWLLLQLADGAFPSGGFAHSAGLEAAEVLGGLPDGDVLAFLDASLRQLGRAQLPFVLAAARDPARLEALDHDLDATLPLAGPNHASRAQGRALASAAARIWTELEGLTKETSRPSQPSHHAPIFGALCGRLGVGDRDAGAAYLHGAARGILSAAVRLGLLGPIEAQRALSVRHGLLDEVLEGALGRSPEDAAQTAPLLEIFAALHERLDGRMFQS